MASCQYTFEQQAECPLLKLLHKALDALATGINQLCRRIRNVFRRRRRFNDAELKKKVMRLAGQRHGRLAREVRAFIADIKARPPQPDPRGHWERCFTDTRRQMNLTRNYLIKRLGTEDTEEELDALEHCVEQLLLEPLYDDLYQRAQEALASKSCVCDMRRLVKRHNANGGIPFERMGAPALTSDSCDRVRSCIIQMEHARLPIVKLEHLVFASDLVTDLMQQENDMIVNSDYLLPMMSWILVHANLINAIVEAEIMLKLVPPEKEAGKAGFYATIMYCASLAVNSTPDPPLPRALASVVSADFGEEDGDSYETEDADYDGIPLAAMLLSDYDDDDDDDDDEEKDAAVQRAEPHADGAGEDSDGYCTDSERARSAQPEEPARGDCSDGDSCFGDDELTYGSHLSLCSLSSRLSGDSGEGTWYLCRSHSDLSRSYSDLSRSYSDLSRSYSDLSAHCSSEESLPDLGHADTKVAQLYSVGTLFSAVPVLFSRAVMA